MSGTLTLYELGDESRTLDEFYEELDGEVTPEMEALETELIEKLTLKADSFGGYVRNMEATSDTLKKEEARLAARRKALDNRVDRLKEYAKLVLIRMERPKVAGSLFSLSVQNVKASVVVECLPAALPAAFVTTVPSQLIPDKNALYNALKKGETIPGARLQPNNTLVIR